MQAPTVIERTHLHVNALRELEVVRPVHLELLALEATVGARLVRTGLLQEGVGAGVAAAEHAVPELDRLGGGGGGGGRGDGGRQGQEGELRHGWGSVQGDFMAAPPRWLTLLGGSRWRFCSRNFLPGRAVSYVGFWGLYIVQALYHTAVFFDLCINFDR